MSKALVVRNNDRTAKSAGGNCKSKCIIYAAQCKLCSINNTYTGKTVQEFHSRINGHRHSYYDIVRSYDLNGEDFSINIDDTNILGAHLLLRHTKSDKSDFNKYFSFTVLKFVNPSTIRINEQSFIDSLHTLYPFGLNNINSISG